MHRTEDDSQAKTNDGAAGAAWSEETSNWRSPSGDHPRARQDSPFSPSHSNVPSNRRYDDAGTLRSGSPGSLQISEEPPELPRTDPISPSKPGVAVSCTCGAIVRFALPGYNSTEADGCTLTRGENECCNENGDWPPEDSTTNCSRKPTLLPQEVLTNAHTKDLMGTSYVDPLELSDGSDD